MNEARFSWNRKHGEDMYTARGETIEEFKTNRDQVIAMLSESSAAETIKDYDGYVVGVRDNALRVWVYADHPGMTYKALTLYDNHFDQLGFNPRAASPQWPTGTAPELEEAKSSQFWHPLKMKIALVPNPRFIPRDQLGPDETPKPKMLFSRMVEPAPIDPVDTPFQPQETSKQKALNMLPGVTLDTKNQFIVNLVNAVNEGRMTDAEADEVRAALTTKLDGTY